jgi:hypothetical protein
VRKTRSPRRTKDETMLVGLAESIGSALGSIAAKAHATQKSLRNIKLKSKLERGGKDLVRRSKKIARELRTTKQGAAKRLNQNRRKLKKSLTPLRVRSRGRK